MSRIIVLLLCVFLLGIFFGCKSEERKIQEHIEQLSSDNMQTRNRSALALARMGPKASSAVPVLRLALYDTEWNVRESAIYALTKIGTNEAKMALREFVPYLMTALEDNNPDERWYAATCLGYMGPLARDAVPLLQSATEDSEIAVSNAASFSLRKIIQ
jgi:HEAT repeat protein